MRNKILPIVVVAMMVCAVIPAISADVVDSEVGTSNAYGEFNFWFNYGEGWSTSPISGEGYNASIALENACSSSNIALTFENVNGLDASNFVDNTGSYLSINSNYGKIASINGYISSETSKWYAYCYLDGEWIEAIDSIGFYKPFSDYDAEFSTANMAFYYGETAIDASTIPTDAMKTVVSVPSNASMPNATDFAVTFTIKITYDELIFGNVCNHVPGSDLTPLDRLKSGVTITGYGSDAALALKNAMISIGCNDYSVYTDVSSLDSDDNIVPNTASYGYFNKLFGIYENSKDNNGDGYGDEYWYWSLYIGSGSSATYASYLIGWYSPLTNAPSGFTSNTFTISYDHSAW